MFDSLKSVSCLRGLIGWRGLEGLTAEQQHLAQSDSGEYFNDKHPALDVDLISQSLKTSQPLNDYLVTVLDAAIIELLNEITTSKKIGYNAKELVSNEVIESKKGWINRTVINEGRFVGVRFRPIVKTGVKLVIHRVAFQFTDKQAALPVYFFHSSQPEAIKQLTFSSQTSNDFNWMEAALPMLSIDQERTGGEYYLGYYQDDLTGQAVHYTKLNWVSGYCKLCDNGEANRRYSSITNYVKMVPFYVPSTSLDTDQSKLFDTDGIIFEKDNNFGMNFHIAVKCDFTQFWCDNRLALKSALALKVTQMILKNISYSFEINAITEQLKMMIIRDLEGDKETNYKNIEQRLEKEIKAINLDHSGMDTACLSEAKKSSVKYSYN